MNIILGFGWDHGGRGAGQGWAVAGGRLGKAPDGKFNGSGLSGNGTGFVWYPGGAQQEEIVQGALIHEVETGFVAVEEGEFGGGGELAEGGGNAGDVVAGGLRGKAFG